MSTDAEVRAAAEAWADAASAYWIQDIEDYNACERNLTDPPVAWQMGYAKGLADAQPPPEITTGSSSVPDPAWAAGPNGDG